MLDRVVARRDSPVGGPHHLLVVPGMLSMTQTSWSITKGVVANVNECEWGGSPIKLKSENDMVCCQWVNQSLSGSGDVAEVNE